MSHEDSRPTESDSDGGTHRNRVLLDNPSFLFCRLPVFLHNAVVPSPAGLRIILCSSQSIHLNHRQLLLHSEQSQSELFQFLVEVCPSVSVLDLLDTISSRMHHQFPLAISIPHRSLRRLHSLWPQGNQCKHDCL